MKGIDGTINGWIAAEFNDDAWSIKFLESLDQLSQPALIDIPIGLPKDSKRRCDSKARKFLSPQRHYSVFNCPVREAVYSEGYEKACEVNEEKTGNRISRQAWNITPKIREADKAVREGIELVESHPEVIFKQLDSNSVEESKLSEEGLEKRRRVLSELGKLPEFAHLVQEKDVSEDDILDALVLAYAAKQSLESMPEKPKNDESGIPMRIMRLDRCI